MSIAYAGPKRPPIITAVTRIQLEEIALDNQTAGVALNAYEAVYPQGAYWLRADAFVPGTMLRGVGLAQASVASGGVLPIWIQGIISNGAWAFTSGNTAYINSGAGSGVLLTTAVPTASGITQIAMGLAITATAVELKPEAPVLIGA